MQNYINHEMIKKKTTTKPSKIGHFHKNKTKTRCVSATIFLQSDQVPMEHKFDFYQ